jgi:Uma2 family endonuclease
MTVLSKKLSFDEPMDEKFILENLDLLPKEDDLPYDDGEPMETQRHVNQMVVLMKSLEIYWGKEKRYFAGGNMFLHYRPFSKKKFLGPDFFLVLDVEQRERKSWVVWQEKMRYPDLIIELLSDSTRKNDHTKKKELYEQVFKTSEYYLYDPFSQEFIGYTLEDEHYELVLPDSDNKIYSPKAHLYLVIHDDWLRWMTEDGMILPTGEEKADQEKLKADQEKLRADQEKLRADQEKLRAEQEKLRADQEKLRAEQEKLRAERVEEQLEQERQRAKQVEQLLEKYRRRFGSLIDNGQ